MKNIHEMSTDDLIVIENTLIMLLATDETELRQKLEGRTCNARTFPVGGGVVAVAAAVDAGMLTDYGQSKAEAIEHLVKRINRELYCERNLTAQ